MRRTHVLPYSHNIVYIYLVLGENSVIRIRFILDFWVRPYQKPAKNHRKNVILQKLDYSFTTNKLKKSVIKL